MNTNINPTGNPIITLPSDPEQSWGGSDSAGELDRFKALAGNVVQVPKSEIDEKRKKP